tara:strand:- start:33 stop:221 length:189 start_codon:yes stop_codon:yes gene_type:complete
MLCGYHLFTGGGIEGWRSGLKKDLRASRTGFFVLSSVFKEQVRRFSWNRFRATMSEPDKPNI